MRSHLLNYEDRQFIHYVIFVCHDVCCRICSYCKLSYRKCIPSAQKILLYIRLVLLRIRIVVTCIVRAIFPSSNVSLRFTYFRPSRNTSLTFNIPWVPVSFGEVNTSPTGIFTSATQFSKLVSFDGSVISCIITVISVTFAP